MSVNNDASKAAFWKQQAFEYNSDTAVGFGEKTTTQLYSLDVVLEKKT